MGIASGIEVPDAEVVLRHLPEEAVVTFAEVADLKKA
jgi:hypothetical protein